MRATALFHAAVVVACFVAGAGVFVASLLHG